MAQFVESVAGDVLRAIAIELLQRQLIRVLSSAGHSAKLRVLLPQIGFDKFSGCKKRRIAHPRW